MIDLVLDVVERALFERLHILAPDLLRFFGVVDVHTRNFIAIRIDLTEKAVLEAFLVPGGKDERLIYLTELGEVLAFIDFFFDDRDHHFSDDLLGHFRGAIIVILSPEGAKNLCVI